MTQTVLFQNSLPFCNVSACRITIFLILLDIFRTVSWYLRLQGIDCPWQIFFSGNNISLKIAKRKHFKCICNYPKGFGCRCKCRFSHPNYNWWCDFFSYHLYTFIYLFLDKDDLLRMRNTLFSILTDSNYVFLEFSYVLLPNYKSV